MKRADIRKIFPDATDEQLSQMLTAVHDETDSLRDQVDQLNTDLNKAKADTGKDPEGWKEKYEAEKASHTKYRNEQTAKETRAEKERALRELLKGSLSENGIEKAIKYADYEKIELENGKIKDAAGIKKGFAEEWADYVTSTKTKGTETKGKDGAGKGSDGNPKTVDEIMAIQDAGARQQAIADNHELFGF